MIYQLFFWLLLVKSGFMMLIFYITLIDVDILFSTLRVYHLISINDA